MVFEGIVEFRREGAELDTTPRQGVECEFRGRMRCLKKTYVRRELRYVLTEQGVHIFRRKVIFLIGSHNSVVDGIIRGSH